MMRCFGWVMMFAAIGLSAAHADDGLGLRRGGNGADVTLSGVSSGAAMAVQYAVAHSASVAGVGAIAGPAWGCARGSLSRAMNTCMCGTDAIAPRLDAARELASRGKIDTLAASGQPLALKRAYVFHSRADGTVHVPSANANIAFLAGFIGEPPVSDWGNAADGSDAAGHGIIAPGGSDACRADGRETSYVRSCGGEDNAGKLFHALFDPPGTAFDPGKRVADVPSTEVWPFSQTALIAPLKAGTEVAADTTEPAVWWPWLQVPANSPRRQNFDMADTGYLYVPPACRKAGSACRVHVALHGCKQNAKDFAASAGYNNWADHYRVIVVYPAIKPDTPVVGESCQIGPVSPALDATAGTLNLNGCWDWWGYLDLARQDGRYLTRAAPQMRVIERIIAEVTAP
jgi:poly(3-hydroxybutyrate) depolymerase